MYSDFPLARSLQESTEKILVAITSRLAQKFNDNGRLSYAASDEHGLLLHRFVETQAQSYGSRAALMGAGSMGEMEQGFSCCFIAEVLGRLREFMFQFHDELGLEPSEWSFLLDRKTQGFSAKALTSENWALLADAYIERGFSDGGLDPEMQSIKELFVRFGKDHIEPIAQ